MFNTLTDPKYPKAALGLEKDSITALALQNEGRGQFGIKQAASLELPKGLLEPNFVDENISNVNEMLLMLERVVVDAGLNKNKKWSVSLPSNSARTAIITLEDQPASKNELEEVIDWKAETSFGVPSGEMRLSRQKISPNREGKTRYFTTATKLSVIDEYETLFESLGWTAGLILPRAISESKWLGTPDKEEFSLLISTQSDGFTALLMRGNEPAVIRSVTCRHDEMDDEIYRLLVYYKDRFAVENDSNILQKLLVVGRELVPERLREITAEALGETLEILRPDEIGLNIPGNSLSFDEVAAPAGLASLGFR